MCGIAGIINRKKKINQHSIKNILSQIKHRGPDADGIWFEKNIGLGSVRLKVVDFDSKSNQPIVSKNKRFVIVFNGEIYNYLELKKKFNLKVQTNSDTEVVVELFSKIGEKTFSYLEGMFAIAIYDKQNSKIYLARDPFGIKPLYYSFKEEQFIFCSEIKGINEILKKREANNNSVIDFIKWGGLDHSRKTWFKNIYNIQAGTFEILDKYWKKKVSRYYDLKKETNKINITSSKNLYSEFNNLLKNSVKEQSKTVRTIGSNLSGGVDSSIVTMILKEINPKITSYTFGYNEKKYDERPFAKKIAKKLKIKNFTSICSSKTINEKFIDTLLIQDEPFTSFRQVSHHKLYEDFKSFGSTVILEASGGDEIGGGYTGFLWPYFLDEINRIGFDNAWKNLISNLQYNKIYNKEDIGQFISAGIHNQKYYGSTTSDGQKIVEDSCINSTFEQRFDLGNPNYEKKFKNNLLNSQQIELFNTKLPRGLRYVDRASSSNGREARVPLLNKKIVNFCFSITNEYKIREGELRWFMKKGANLFDKKKIILENKRSIADPQRIWLRKDFKNLLINLFKSKKFRERGIFNPENVIYSYNKFLGDPKRHSLGIFQIFITEVWFRLFIDNNPSDYKGVKLDQFIEETN